jgi:hypothetical protein
MLFMASSKYLGNQQDPGEHIRWNLEIEPSCNYIKDKDSKIILTNHPNLDIHIRQPASQWKRLRRPSI